MTPVPQEPVQPATSVPPQDGNRIVISGMSGLYPRSRNIKEFSDILYNKVNPVTSSDLRFKYNHPEVMQYSGTVPELNRFDAQFFKVNFRLATEMDPMGRKLLEQSYQAIYDAGINPEELSGKKVGVYIGLCFSEAEQNKLYTNAGAGYVIPGCSRAMFANRVSYWLNTKGPSMAINGTCCSSTVTLEQACSAISRGECESAIVGGSYLCLHPQSSVHYARIIKLSKDDKTKSFDEHADGCAKSEAVNVLFLQKAKDALRVYAEIVHTQTIFTCNLKEVTGQTYGFYRDLDNTIEFLKKFYEDARVSPQCIEYVEAFGSGLPEADKVELQTIEEVFCEDRQDPLLVGSVMSNIGYGEGASGISAITKVLLGFHNGELAANLHCENPRKDIAALRDGRMHILTEHQRFGRSYVAVNGLSVTGVNSHVLLHGRYKPKDLNRYKTCMPYLVNISGRHEDAVKHVLSILKSNPVDPEQLALLHNIHKESVTGHLGRGYIILHTNEEEKTKTLYEKTDNYDDMRQPLWFVYSGMGSQWAGMGAQLMHIPIFAAAIERCQQILESKGLDIVNIITLPDESIFDNILNSFVGIAAIQIGLTDVLRELGLKPDGIIGHSVGEFGCAYADGCLTTEEMILSAYYRGLVSLETKFIHGSMAAIGMGYAQISKICPPELEVACHNGPESSTISGPSDVMREFVSELTIKGIFAKEVSCSNIAYHSRYIADAGPGLLRYLKEVIPTPKLRSERWFSTSVPINSWNEPTAKFCSAEYLTNNLLSPVLFEETSRLVPNNAVLVEIAPHGLLQAILKRSMPASCKNIPLTRRKHPDNTFLLEAIGKLYMEGYNTNLQVLYPKVEMPVSTGTPFLSHFVKWTHDENWPLPLYNSANRKIAAHCDFVLAIHDKEHAYLRGHSIRGKTVYPFAASLTLVWDTLAMLMGVPRKELSVEFRNIQFYAQPILHDSRQLKLNVSIQRGDGSFELRLDLQNITVTSPHSQTMSQLTSGLLRPYPAECEENSGASSILDGKSKVAIGFITPIDANKSQNVVNVESLNMHYTAEDIYKLLQDRDYFYSGEFQSIECVDESLSGAKLVWRDNWATFIDGMLQLNALRQQHHSVSQPTSIQVLCIDVKAHSNDVLRSSQISDGKILLKAKISDDSDCTRCGGVLMKTVQYQHLPPVVTKMALKALKFVPYFKSALDFSSSLEVFLQIVAENLNKNVLNVVGIQTKAKEGSIFKKIRIFFNNVFEIKVNYKKITPELATNNYKFENVDVILVQYLATDKNVYQRLKEVLHHGQFVVSEENSARPDRVQFSSIYQLLSVHNIINNKNNQQSVLQLIRWGPATELTNMTTVSVHKESDFEFLTSSHANLASGHSLLVISCYPSPPGLKNLVSTLRKQSVRNKIYMVTIKNTSDSDVQKQLRNLQLANNCVNDGDWGDEFYLPVTESTKARENVTLQSVQFGANKSLEWVQAPELIEPGVTVNIHYAGINTNDMKNASSSLYIQNVNNRYGMDCSGITESGQPVMGLVRSGAASTKVRVQPELLWPVPGHWSLEDAATVPLAYVQAFYCLGITIRLLPGQTVLVHGGAGALGQAIISIALAHDCEVFTTVSDTHKKYFLLKLFPALKADHIGNSRDYTFIDTIRMKSRCDIIISCVEGNLKDMTFKCAAVRAVFLDVSQLQNRECYDFGMFNLNEDIDYYRIDLFSLFEAENMKNMHAIHKMISEGIARGYVRPLTRITYTPQEVPRAFQLLAASQHRGRVLLRMKENNMQAQFRLKCSAHHFYLIVCNQSPFGLQFADRLVARGAKQLFLHVPRQSAYLQYKIRSWQRCRVNVVVSSENINSQKNIASLLTTVTNYGPLEGVFVIFGEKDTQTNLISDLDVEIKSLCPDVRYFAVINIGVNSIGKNVYLNRLCHQLPAIMIELPKLQDDSNINWHGAVDATERALESRRGVFLAHMEREHKPSMLQQIATLTGLIIPENVSRSLTLGELGIQKHTLKSLCSFLQLHYNLAFEEEQVPSLTINAIKKAEKQITDITFDDKKGLSTFFSYIDPDELLATAESVFLTTLTTNASMRDDEFQSDQMNLCIIPGMEGLHERFRVLCRRLKLSAVVLQPGLDHLHETVRETAERFVEVLVKRIGVQSTFYLMGYETGVFVALEIAAILEDRGLTGKVFCVGCAPNEFENELAEQLKAFEDEKQLEEGVLRHMYTLMTGDDSKVLEHELRDLETFSQKLEVCVPTLLGRVPHSIQYARALLESALARIKIARSYSMSACSLRSQVVLLRAARGRPTLQYTALQHLSQQPVVVHELDSTLANIVTNLRCAAIINDHLDPVILEKFAAKNICSTYLLNAQSFIDNE